MHPLSKTPAAQDKNIQPGGETCAAGNLLMLAPINWPYQPAEKQMTRNDAQVLNRIAQLISGEGAIAINYKGAIMRGVDEGVVAATSSAPAHI